MTGLMGVDTAADAVRRRALRRMRTVATSLLVLAAVVYVLTHGHGGAWGYVNAGAEASMVGAIADWFAVTALFRHPLGLPIPHTALIPRRKDDIGASLEEFVGENFLAEDVIRDRLRVSEPALRVGLWLAEEPNARALVREGSTVAADGLARLRDDHIAAVVTEAIVPRLREEPLATVVGTALAEVLADGVHQGVVDLFLTELHGWLVDHEATVTDVVGERAPWWVPPALRDAGAARVHIEIVRWVADILAEPDHRARKAIDSMLAELADDLQHNPETQARADGFKNRLLDHPQVLTTSISLWDALRRTLVSSLRDPDGAVQARVLSEVQLLAGRLVGDEVFRARADRVVADAATYLVKRYGSEATAVITHTIERWDGREAAQRIELHVGRDLQFIRINGTIVGGLVGVLIHTVTQLLS